jgi:hypothetical protein
MRRENRLEDRAKSPDPDDLTRTTPPTRPMTPAELRAFEEEIVPRDEEPVEDVPGPPPAPSAE